MSRPTVEIARAKRVRWLLGGLMLALPGLAAPAQGIAQEPTVAGAGDRAPKREVAGDVGALRRFDAITLNGGEAAPVAAVIDPAGEFAYFPTINNPAAVVKVDLDPFERVGAVPLESGESSIRSAVIDPEGQFAYFGTETFPGRVVKFDLDAFERVDGITLNDGEDDLRSAAIDPAGEFAYFGTFTTPGRVVKIDLETFERVDAITLDSGEDGLVSAVIDPGGEFAYFSTETSPPRVVKIDLDTFERVDALMVDIFATTFLSAVIDPAGDFAYLGTSNDQGRVVKIDLNAFQRVDTVVLGLLEGRFTSAVIDPVGEFAYFGSHTSPAKVIKIDLDPFQRADAITLEEDEDLLTSAVIDPAGRFAYFGTFQAPGRVIKVGPALSSVALEVDYVALASDGNGVFEPGEQVDVAPAWRNGLPSAQELTGAAAELTGPAGLDYILLADTADYGEVAPEATASCRGTGTCYQMEIGPADAPRPATHWDATFQETLPDEIVKTWTLHLGDSFADVPRASPFYPAIETVLHHAVTGGCSDTEYCPTGINSRGQMAVFLLKAIQGEGFTPPACQEGDQMFDDVPATNPFCAWIEALAARNVTTGCGGGNYCPGAPVTRAQMSVFLLKALEGSSYTPPPCVGEFDDVDCPSAFAAWIEELAAREITSGCGGGDYCPVTPVTRGQMAAFVTKTFGLTLYRP